MSEIPNESQFMGKITMLDDESKKELDKYLDKLLNNQNKNNNINSAKLSIVNSIEDNINLNKFDTPINLLNTHMNENKYGYHERATINYELHFSIINWLLQNSSEENARKYTEDIMIKYLQGLQEDKKIDKQFINSFIGLFKGKFYKYDEMFKRFDKIYTSENKFNFSSYLSVLNNKAVGDYRKNELIKGFLERFTIHSANQNFGLKLEE